MNKNLYKKAGLHSMIRMMATALLVTLPLLGNSMPNEKIKNYSTEAKQFMNMRPDTDNTMDFWEKISVTSKILFDKSYRIPDGRLPDVKPDMTSFLAPSQKLKFIWFGHSTLLLNLNGRIILIDPIFSNAASPLDFLNQRFQPAALRMEDLPHVDAIVISHDHYDHLDEKTIKFFKDKTSEFIVPLRVGEHLRDWGIPISRITELDWYESHTYDGLVFTATPARHFSGRGLFDYNKTLWASWVIQGKSEKIYYSGDSSYSEHFKEIGEQFGPFDLAFIENGQYDKRWLYAHMLPEETIQAAIDVNARAFVPVHWGMFDMSLHHWSEPITNSFRLAKSRGVPIATPRMGEISGTAQRHDYSPWWSAILPRQGLAQTQVSQSGGRMGIPSSRTN